MTNRIAEVTKMLGVELGEVFKITDDTHDNYPRYYRVTENVGVETSDDGVKWGMTKAGALECLLMGYVRIAKLPWKPQEGEKYYVPRIAIQPEDRHYYYYWDNDGVDIKRYDMGIVCKTKEEAVALTEKMLAAAKEGKSNG